MLLTLALTLADFANVSFRKYTINLGWFDLDEERTDLASGWCFGRVLKRINIFEKTTLLNGFLKILDFSANEYLLKCVHLVENSKKVDSNCCFRLVNDTKKYF